MLKVNRLTALLAQKMTWFNASAQVHSRNIAHADTPGVTRQQMRDFSKMVDNRRRAPASTSPSILPALYIAPKDTIDTQAEIAKEMEMLSMTDESLKWQAVLNLYRKYSAMNKAVLGRNQ